MPPYDTASNVNQSQTAFQSGSGNTSTNLGQTGNQAFSNLNQYGAGSQMLQGMLPQMIANFLQTGNLPGTFAAPQQVIDAFKSNYAQTVAPQTAATYGANSPLIGGQESLGLQNLLSNLYQTQANNFNNVIANAGNLAFNPIGSSGLSGTNTASKQNSYNNWQTNNSMLGALASSGISGAAGLGNVFGGGLPGGGNPFYRPPSNLNGGLGPIGFTSPNNPGIF